MDIKGTQIASSVIAELAKNAAISIKDSITKYVESESVKADIDYGDAFEQYLKITSEKNSKVKTLIYRQEPKRLQKIYECVGVSLGKTQIKTNQVNNLLDVGHKLIITGTGGIGKTTLLKHLFLNTIETTNYIPILVELRSINSMEMEEVMIEDLVFRVLSKHGLDMKKEYFRYSLEAGKYLIFFDGYDEVKREKSEKVTKQIREMSTCYPNNYYIVSSRPSDEFLGWSDFCELKSNALSKEQAVSLIKRLDFNEPVKELFCKELERELYDKYRSFASNPLLLTIMLLTFDNRAAIPNRLNDFYEQAFATLFNIHDATKDSFKRDIRTKLGCEDFKLVFSYFCFKSYFRSEYEFTEPRLRHYIEEARNKFTKINFRVDDFQEDLIKSVCMIVKDGLKYMFSHRSFQEYFAAWYTTKLTDDVQKKLIVGWLIECKGFPYDSYFSMLYDLQSEKFDKLILMPGLKKLSEEYQKAGFSYDFLTNLFESITIRPKEDKISESLSIKDNYLCSIFRMTCLFHKYTRMEEGKSDDIFVEYAKSKMEDKKNRFLHLEFKDIVADDMIEPLLEEISWVKEQIEFSVGYYEKLKEEYTIGRARKVSSILDSL